MALFEPIVEPMLVLLLAHRLRRWTNIKPALVQRIVFARNVKP